MICFPKTYCDHLRKIKTVMDSPVLPKNCVDILQEYIDIVERNTLELANTIEEFSQNLPQELDNYHKNPKQLYIIFWNQYNGRLNSLEGIAKKITDYVRNYLKVESVVD